MASGMTLKETNVYAQSEYEIIFQNAGRSNSKLPTESVKLGKMKFEDTLHHSGNQNVLTNRNLTELKGLGYSNSFFRKSSEMSNSDVQSNLTFENKQITRGKSSNHIQYSFKQSEHHEDKKEPAEINRRFSRYSS